jgi:hypothetical protein
MADPDPDDANENLVRTGGLQRHVGDGKGRVRFRKNRGPRNDPARSRRRVFEQNTYVTHFHSSPLVLVCCGF